MKIIINALSKKKFQICLLFIYTITINLITLLIPSLTGKYIDYLNKEQTNPQYMKTFALMFFIITIVLVFISYRENILNTSLNNEVMSDIYFPLINHIEKLPLSFFKNIETSEFNVLLIEDCYVLSDFSIETIAKMPLKIIMILVIFRTIFTSNVILGFFSLAMIPFYSISISLFGKKIIKMNKSYKSVQSHFFGVSTDRLRLNKFIRIYSLNSKYNKDSKEAYSTLFKENNRFAKLTYWYNNASFLINQLGTLVLFVFSGYLISKNYLSIGNFIIVNSYFILLISIITYFVNYSNQYHNSKASYDRVHDILKNQHEKNGVLKADVIDKIELKNLCIYQSNKLLIKNLNYTFRQGNIYCIIGTNGVGKTTLIDSILGIVPIKDGIIKFNDIQIDEIDKIHLRKEKISYMEQFPTLVHGTVLENVILTGEKKITELNIDPLLFNKLKTNPVTLINPTIINCSGGELAKIGFLRSLYKNSDVVILDEPTANIDNNTVDIIINELKYVKKDKIIIVISHDKRVIEIADNILELTIPT